MIMEHPAVKFSIKLIHFLDHHQISQNPEGLGHPVLASTQLIYITNRQLCEGSEDKINI